MSQNTRLQTAYMEKIVPALKAELGLANVHQVPRLTKVTLNVGLKSGIKDPKFVEHVENILGKISGQKAVKTLAKKSISNFKIREGNIVGVAVTIRGARMYDFVDKLVNLTLPRVRDFRGLSLKSIDHHGNYTIGFKEFMAFPEIDPEDADYVHGLEVTIGTDAKDKAKGLALLKALGLPFRAVNDK